MNVKQMEVSSLIMLAHFLVDLQLHSQAVLESGRKKEGRPSLLDETILMKYMEVPKGPGTAHPRQSLNPRPRRQPFMCLHALHVKNTTYGKKVRYHFLKNLFNKATAIRRAMKTHRKPLRGLGCDRHTVSRSHCQHG